MFEFDDFDWKNCIRITPKRNGLVTTEWKDFRHPRISFNEGKYVGLISNCVGCSYVFGIGIVVERTYRKNYDVFIVEVNSKAPTNNEEHKHKIKSFESWEIVEIINWEPYNDLFANASGLYRTIKAEREESERAQDICETLRKNINNAKYYNLNTRRFLKQRHEGYIYEENPKIAYTAEQEPLAKRVKQEFNKQ